MLSASQLASFQARVAAAFDKSAVIWRQTVTFDGFGNPQPGGWAALNGGASVPCGWYRPRSANQRPIGGEMGAVNQPLLQFAFGTDIQIGDYAVVDHVKWHVQNTNKSQSLPVALDVSVLSVEGAPEEVA